MVFITVVFARAAQTAICFPLLRRAKGFPRVGAVFCQGSGKTSLLHRKQKGARSCVTPISNKRITFPWYAYFITLYSERALRVYILLVERETAGSNDGSVNRHRGVCQLTQDAKSFKYLCVFNTQPVCCLVLSHVCLQRNFLVIGLAPSFQSKTTSTKKKRPQRSL